MCLHARGEHIGELRTHAREGRDGYGSHARARAHASPSPHLLSTTRRAWRIVEEGIEGSSSTVDHEEGLAHRRGGHRGLVVVEIFEELLVIFEELIRPGSMATHPRREVVTPSVCFYGWR